MSSTGRGTARNADDFYATPAWAVDAILGHVGPLAGRRVLEPSAGDGAILRRLLAAGAGDIVAIEVDAMRAQAARDVPEALVLLAERRPWVINDRFEAWAHGSQRFDLVIMNPPFLAAQDHVERAISLLAPGGLCVALLRLAFCTSKKRGPFRAAHPFDMMILSSRPSFTGHGTDSAEYAWFMFGTRADGTPCGGRFEVLEGGRS